MSQAGSGQSRISFLAAGKGDLVERGLADLRLPRAGKLVARGTLVGAEVHSLEGPEERAGSIAELPDRGPVREFRSSMKVWPLLFGD